MKKKNKDFISQDSVYRYHAGGELFPHPTMAHTAFQCNAVDRVIHFFNSLTQEIYLTFGMDKMARNGKFLFVWVEDIEK